MVMGGVPDSNQVSLNYCNDNKSTVDRDVASTITWSDYCLATGLGAELGHSNSGKHQVKLYGHVANFHVAWHALPRQEVIPKEVIIYSCGAAKIPCDVRAVLLPHACRQDAARATS